MLPKVFGKFVVFALFGVVYGRACKCTWYLYLCADGCMHMCLPSRPEIYVICLPLLLSTRTRSSKIQLDGQASKHQGSSCLGLPSSGFQVQARFLCGWLGIWTQVLSLAQQALDWLNHFPSPLIFFLYSFIIHIIESFHDHTPTSNLKGYIIINLLRKSNSLLKIKRNYRVTQSSTPVLRLLWIDLCFAT